MDVNEKEEIKREFQLERMILFSDAVFAIIITIMVLEIRLPEGLRHATDERIKEAFFELIPKLAGYIVSFVIVAVFWARHLKIFGYLKDYTTRLIGLNMAFLFFISLFPFSVSLMTGALKPNNPYGAYTYVTIVLMTLFTQSAITAYLVKNADAICIKPKEIETDLEWKAQRANLITIPILLIFSIIGLIADFEPYVFSYAFSAWGISAAYMRRKYRNTGTGNNTPLLARLFKLGKMGLKRRVSVLKDQ